MIRTGIGGWDFDGWRGSFYPPGLPRTRQLAWAAQHLGAIEINATYYKTQSPALFEAWAAHVPDGFKFAIKGSRFCSNRKDLAQAGEAVARFCGQGLSALGDRLGPVLWQLMDSKKFDAAEMQAFFALLPRAVDGVALSHVIEARHPSFADPAFAALAAEAGVGVAYADTGLGLAQVGGGVAYARLQGTREDEPQGYCPAALDGFAEQARGWAAAGAREVYLFVIGGAKVRNPAAAMALAERV